MTNDNDKVPTWTEPGPERELRVLVGATHPCHPATWADLRKAAEAAGMRLVPTLPIQPRNSKDVARIAELEDRATEATTAIRERDERLTVAERRIAELEREVAALDQPGAVIVAETEGDVEVLRMDTGDCDDDALYDALSRALIVERRHIDVLRSAGRGRLRFLDEGTHFKRYLREALAATEP